MVRPATGRALAEATGDYAAIGEAGPATPQPAPSLCDRILAAARDWRGLIVIGAIILAPVLL